jgi:putative membrane protein
MEDAKRSLSDILALDRTRMAAERTLMGWIRTSFSMITFGFTIYKVMQELSNRMASQTGQEQEPRHLGLVLAAIGTLALVGACVQHRIYTKQLRHEKTPWDLSFLIACIVACLGLLILGGLMFRMGPFA